MSFFIILLTIPFPGFSVYFLSLKYGLASNRKMQNDSDHYNVMSTYKNSLLARVSREEGKRNMELFTCGFYDNNRQCERQYGPMHHQINLYQPVNNKRVFLRRLDLDKWVSAYFKRYVLYLFWKSCKKVIVITLEIMHALE